MMTSDQLRGWRAAKRWTQQEAADRLGYSRRGYQDVEAKPGAIGLTLELAVSGLELTSAKPCISPLHGTTNGDLSDEENVRQAEHELHRAETDAALADWTRRWGESAVARCYAAAGIEDGAADDLARAEADATKAEEDLAEIKQAADALVSILDEEVPDQSPKLMNAIAALENVG